MSLELTLSEYDKLSELYLQAERLMSLRSTNRDQLEEISKLIENLYAEVISKLNEEECVDVKKIQAVTKNYSEFNARISDWLNTLSSLPVCDNPEDAAPTVISNTSSSSASSRSTIRQREAFAKLKLAELEAAQAEERAVENAERAKREARRKLEIAALEFKVWNTVDTEIQSPRYDKLNKHVNFDILHENVSGPSSLCNPKATLSSVVADLAVASNKPMMTTERNFQNAISSQGANNAKLANPTSSIYNIYSGPAPPAAPLRSNERGNSKLPPPKTVSITNDGNNLNSWLNVSAPGFVPSFSNAQSNFASPPHLNAVLSSSSSLSRPVSSTPKSPQHSPTWTGPPGIGTFPHHGSYEQLAQPFGYSPYFPQYQPVQNPYRDEFLLPRPQIPKFDGNPLNFMTFKNNFVKHIVPKVADRKMLLCYLLQHCEPKIRDKIQHFSNKGEAGYSLASDRLEKEYGRPSVIADACEQRLKSAKPVKSNDPEGLKYFSDLLEKTFITLEDIRFFGSLNSLDTMSLLINKLPFDLRRAWVKESVTVEQRTGQIADFSCFVSFVANISEEANSLYGRRVFGTHLSRAHTDAHSVTTRSADPRKSTISSHSIKVTASTATDQTRDASQNSLSCFYCKHPSHKLLECSKFKSDPLSKRVEFVKSNKLCNKCLSSKHRTPNCPKQNTCSFEGCTGTFHHFLLHPRKHSSLAASTPNSLPLVTASSSTQTEISPSISSVVKADPVCSTQASKAVYLCVVPVKLRFDNKVVNTYAFLDQGSTHSFCDSKLVNALGITGTSEKVVLQTLTGSKSHKSLSCSFTVSSLDESSSFCLSNVLSVGDIPISPNILPASSDLYKFPHLSDLEFPTLPGATVTLLIGADAPEIFCFRSTRVGSRGQPIAVETPLGWSLLGPSLSLSTSKNCQVNLTRANRSLQKQIDSLWETDFSDSTSVLDVPSSREDRIVFDLMQSSVKMVNGHYSLPLPWRPDCHFPSNNFVVAERRLASLKKRLSADKELHQKYTKVVDSYLQNGYARKIPSDELNCGAGVVEWYLPHHPVLNPKKPGKVRVVFDCAASHRGVCLNDTLMQGPDLVNSLVGVLLRFRKERIAITADIEAMFHQVRVSPSHCQALRFLWWPEGVLSSKPEVHQMLVHLFGATSSPSCAAFCLRKTAQDFGNEFDSDISDIVADNFYVDDCLCSVSSVENGVKVVTQLPKLLQKGGFRLTKWLTNNFEVLQAIPEQERSPSLQLLDFNGTSIERVLGMCWHVEFDYFQFSVKLPERALTRRGVLSSLSSLFDPLGFLSPIILLPKLLLQSLCKQGLGWDDQIPQPEADQWTSWLHNLPLLSNFKVERCFKPANFGRIASCELHHFADASALAYGVCSYLRLTDEHGKIHCSLLMSKSRLAPIKAMSIPRLELSAAVLSVRLDIFLRKELHLSLSDSTFWSDSTAVLQIIRNPRKRFPVFVANRVSVIERHTNLSSWRHVPSHLNSADLITRPTTAEAFLSRHKWLSGPDFLYVSCNLWPPSPIVSVDLPSDFTCPSTGVAQSCCTIKDISPIDNLVNHFSSFYRLKKAVAWLLRCRTFLLSKAKKLDQKLDMSQLTVDELQHAEFQLIRYIQAREFSSVISSLSRNTPLKNFSLSRPFSKLNPVLVEGILRVGGRLEKAPIDYDARHPIILPNSSHFTNLLILHHHNLVGHSGMGHTWSSIRLHYWIIKGGATVRRVIGQCVFCKKRNAPVSQQLMADLPPARLQLQEPAFSHVGCDYFGPLFVKQGRSEVKRYGCIFTCLTMRAVHIEISKDLSTDSFVNALRRFICRRGTPRRIYSDNGTNFVGANKELRECLRSWNQAQIDEFLLQQQIRWTFNPPAASHMGGAWERLIRSTRRILHALMKGQVVTDEVLNTLMTEVESILNSRPLIPVTFDPRDDEPLTPNHLLLLRGNSNLPPGLFEKKDCYARRRWAQAQYLADQFWRRWTREYLPHICQLQKWQQKQRNLAPNDIVLIVDNSLPRSKWAMGRILETFPNKSGLIRSVSIKTQKSVLTRPISKLCLILKAEDN